MSLTQEKKEATWNTIKFFYPDYNPFAAQFTIDDVNTEVERVALKMAEDFGDCAKLVVPLEILSIITAIIDVAKWKDSVAVALALVGLLNSDGSLAYEACRNTQAAARRTDLYMAFIGL